MGRLFIHPNLALERLLQELESRGVDPRIIDNFVVHARLLSQKSKSKSEEAGQLPNETIPPVMP